MSLIRSTTLRASSIARAARPARCLRTAELQPWRRAIQRRTYASEHGGHGETKSSDIPWAASAAVATVAGLYFVITQDTSGGHHEDHDDHGQGHAEKDDDEAPAEESKDEESDDSGDDNKDEDKGNSRDKEKDDSKATPPDESDTPDPRKEQTKSQNETSGKQKGMSNADTKHSSNISEQSEKSKKGEGVAETAKLQGTVSTERPGAENKAERGKAKSDKDA